MVGNLVPTCSKTRQLEVVVRKLVIFNHMIQFILKQ